MGYLDPRVCQDKKGNLEQMVYKESQEETVYRDRLECPDLPDCQVEMDFPVKKENEESLVKRGIQARKVKKEAKVLQVLQVGMGYLVYKDPKDCQDKKARKEFKEEQVFKECKAAVDKKVSKDYQDQKVLKEC